MLGVASATKVENKFKVRRGFIGILTLLLIPPCQDNQVDTDLKMSLKQHIIQTEFGNISVYIQVSASQLLSSDTSLSREI